MMTPNDARSLQRAGGTCRWRRLLAPGLAVIVLASAVLTAHASAQTMIEPERVAVSVRGAGATSDRAAMRRVIVEAAARHGWRVTLEQPDRLTLHVASGDHAASIDVFYDAGGFQIKYRDSAQMDYEVEDGRALIHPRYNKWVTELGNEIRREARNGVSQRRLHAVDSEVRAPGAGEAPGAGQ